MIQLQMRKHSLITITISPDALSTLFAHNRRVLLPAFFIQFKVPVPQQVLVSLLWWVSSKLLGYPRVIVTSPRGFRQAITFAVGADFADGFPPKFADGNDAPFKISLVPINPSRPSVRFAGKAGAYPRTCHELRQVQTL